MRHLVFLFLVFFSFAASAASGLITPPGRNESLSFKARSHSPYDDSVTYREPYLNGNAQAFPLAAQGKKPKDVDYDRICRLLGHSFSINVEPQLLDEEVELYWIESGAMFPKFHNQIIFYITCN